MWLYLIIFLIPVAAFYLGGAVNRSRAFLAWYMVGLALFVGLSDMFGGYDRYIYGAVFDSIADGISYGAAPQSIAMMGYYEFGYSALCYLIALVTENRYVYIFIITALMYFCFYKAIEKNMTNYPLAMILFLGMVFFFTFTYLRQVLAFSVAWLGVNFLVEGKKWKFFAVVVVVALLHKSGIVFAGLYFMPLKKWRPKVVLTVLCVCLIVGITGVTGALYDAFASASEANAMNGYSTGGAARIAYLLEVAFFVWIILKNYRKIEPTRRNLIFLNMAWAFCAMLLLFLRSSDGGRVAWFFTLGIIYTVTLVCCTDKFRRGVKTSMGALMAAVMLALYVRVYGSWQQYDNLYPYKTFLTDGHRYPDYSWENYEYDHLYDLDKFHRPAFR
ncbi:MAG: EpsG family protein, partial [Clostridium sp.]|nr:EpsG family protein [Clostridium sp.]